MSPARSHRARFHRVCWYHLGRDRRSPSLLWAGFRGPLAIESRTRPEGHGWRVRAAGSAALFVAHNHSPLLPERAV